MIENVCGVASDGEPLLRMSVVLRPLGSHIGPCCGYRTFIVALDPLPHPDHGLLLR
jgi:hypothetical protein